MIREKQIDEKEECEELLELAVIEPVKGHGKGKYAF
jgi:hypothetical protein